MKRIALRRLPLCLARYLAATLAVCSVMLLTFFAAAGRNDDAFSMAVLASLAGCLQNAVPVVLHGLLPPGRPRRLTVLCLPFAATMIVYALWLGRCGDEVSGLGLPIALIGLLSPAVFAAANAWAARRWFYWLGVPLLLLAAGLALPVSRL